MGASRSHLDRVSRSYPNAIAITQGNMSGFDVISDGSVTCRRHRERSEQPPIDPTATVHPFPAHTSHLWR